MPTFDLSGLKILDDPGIGGDTAIARAALRHFGEYYRPDGVPWTGWCEMYIGNVMAEAGIAHPRFESALVDAINGSLYRGQAPAGALVFFDQRANPYGHVGVAMGNGTMLSALGGGIVRTTYTDWVSYLGWRPYGTTARAEELLVITPLLDAPTSPSPDGGTAVSVPVVPTWPVPDTGPIMPPYT
ncbi:MAG: NlpC/P60 family protein [Chloroflexota bacterium]|nr:NlpC/P60 family protein [Chloroflexota bacterium]